jgi:AcrR family transcriptional regulator
MVKKSFREQMLVAREDAIVTSVNRLLAEKGFEFMTVDEVAADVGIAKASLYRHFASKEALATAAMVRLLENALGVIESPLTSQLASPLDKLKAVTRWALQSQLDGKMPSLPAQNSALRTTLLQDSRYLDLLMQVSDRLGSWIEQAQADRLLNPQMPPEVVLYTLFARCCDPVMGFLKSGSEHSNAQIIDWVIATCFDGLAAR